MPNSYIAVFDIGHSVTNASYGWLHEKRPTTFSFPSVTEQLQDDQSIDIRSKDVVEVDNNLWRVGMDYFCRDQSSNLYWQYHRSDSFKAIFRSMLKRLKPNNVDLLVVTLPNALLLNNDEVNYLRKELEGHHNVGEKSIFISEVYIAPSTLGAIYKFKEHEASELELQNLDLHCIGIIDVGYFSIDYCLMQQGTEQELFTGSNLDAVSRIAEFSAKKLFGEYGSIVRPEMIENSLNNNENSVLVGSQWVDISDILRDASEEVCKRSIDSIMKCWRGEVPATIILTGGGANMYKPYINQAFGHMHLKQLGAKAVATGLWYFARQYI